jgi:hypothetical protein
LTILICLLITFLRIDNKIASYHPGKIINLIRDYRTVREYLFSRFIDGIYGGVGWAVLGIVLYQFVKNMFVWGIVSTILTLLTIIGSYYYGKLNNRGYYKATAGFSTLIFAGITIMLATNWNIVTFMIYQLALTAINIMMGVNYEQYIFATLHENEDIESCQNELIGASEIVLGIGRILPLLVMVWSGITLDNELGLRILFILISSAPLIVMSIVNRSSLFSTRYVILEK